MKLFDEATVAFWTKRKTEGEMKVFNTSRYNKLPPNETALESSKNAQNPIKKRAKPEIMETCKVCGIKNRKDLLRAHMKIHQSKKECPRCHKLYGNLNCHLRHCQKEIGCVECGEVLKGKKALRL